jgi:Tol biopolymer transport system component
MNLPRMLAILPICLLFVACSRDATPPAGGEVEIPLTRFTTHEAIERGATWSPDGQWIAFGSMRSGATDIWIKPTAGDPARQLTTDPAHDTYPIWSPDGTRVAFTSDRGGVPNVWTIDINGGAAVQVTTAEHGVSFGWAFGSFTSWSPDSEWIAFSTGGTRDSNIWIVPSRGGTARQLTQGSGEALPSWSPDGESIAYCSDESGNWDIWIVGVEGGEARQITDHPTNDQAPSWSPDGRWLAFQSDRSGSRNTWIVPATGGAPLQITDIRDGHAVVPRWSPDGRRLSFNGGPQTQQFTIWSVAAAGGESALVADNLFGQEFNNGYVRLSPDRQKVGIARTSREGMNRDIWIQPLAGSSEQLTQGGMVSLTERAIAWSVDGAHLAFTSDRGGNANIWRVPTAGGRPRQVTVTNGKDIFPAWSPDGAHIAFTSNTNGHWDIWIAPAQGGKAEPLTSELETEWEAAWSPDSKYIAFNSQKTRKDTESSYRTNIWIAPVAGGDATWLAEGSGASWSPDGETIAFDIDAKIWVVAAAGGTPRLVTQEDLDYSFRPVWSSDSKEFSFFRRGGNTDIWIADLANLEVLGQ